MIEPNYEIEHIKEVVSEFLQEKEAIYDSDRRFGFHCSSLGSEYTCQRAHILDVLCKMHGIESERRQFSDEIRLVFKTGHAEHDMLREHVFGPAQILKGTWENRVTKERVEGFMPLSGVEEGQHPAEVWKYVEKSVYTGQHNILGHEAFDIVGSVDAVFEIFGKDFVVDIKTSNNYYFNKVSRNGMDNEGYIAQINLYMYLTGIHRGLFVVYNKDNSKLCYIPIEYDEELVQNLIKNNVMTPQHLFSKGLLPSRVAGCEDPNYEKPLSCHQCKLCFSCDSRIKDLPFMKKP